MRICLNIVSQHEDPRPAQRRWSTHFAATIPGATIVRKQKRFALTAPDDFCEFVVGGKTFLAIEPFGDNSEFWVVGDPPEECPQIGVVRSAFEAYRLLGSKDAG